ncbi:MAG: acetolactate synthase [Verrucomicrobia bacterium]|nr:acetolactate synthase [Verrucomicrobiota bacterium]
MPIESKTAEALRGPKVRHFSVFLPNRVGMLMELTKALGDANVHICGLDVINTADSAILRMVVDDPGRCRDVLARKGFASAESEAIAVELPQGPEKLAAVLGILLTAEINIEFTYSLMVRPRDKAVLLLHVDDEEFACDVLAKAGVAVLGQADISR